MTTMTGSSNLAKVSLFSNHGSVVRCYSESCFENPSDAIEITK